MLLAGAGLNTPWEEATRGVPEKTLRPDKLGDRTAVGLVGLGGNIDKIAAVKVVMKSVKICSYTDSLGASGPLPLRGRLRSR